MSFTDREEGGNTRGFDELSYLYTYVDTSESLSATKHLLAFFDVSSWVELYCAPYHGPYILRTYYRTTPSLSMPNGVVGSFSYFDFSTSVNLNTWFEGQSCHGIRFQYHKTNGKGLQLDMRATDGGYAEAFCLYEFPENLVYTPYVSFRIGVEMPEGVVDTQLYEVVLTSGTGRTSIVASSVVQAGQTVTLVLDLSEYVRSNMTDYWKIGVRPLGEAGGACSLLIYDVVGYSTEYNSEDLATLIKEERLRIRNLEIEDDENDNTNEQIWMFVGIVVVILLVGVVVFIFLRSNDEKERKEESEEDSST